MLYYSVFNCFPNQGLDSILIFEFDKVLCSYPFRCKDGAASVEFVNFLYKIEQTKIRKLSRPDAEDIILKHDALQSYQQTKTLVAHLWKASSDEELQMAHRAARKNYVLAVQNFSRSSPNSNDFELLYQQKLEADAIFKVIRRVYEQEHMLDECLPRGFDGLTEETIDSIYRQECLDAE